MSETVVMAQGLVLGGTVGVVDYVEVIDHVEVVGHWMVEIEVVLVGVVAFPSNYLAMNLVLTSTAVRWKVVQMNFGHTCFGTVEVDLDMTWDHLMGNLVPWDSLALARHSQLVDTGLVGLPE